LERGRNPRWWLDQAQLLKKAADIVLKQVKIDEGASTVQVGWISHIWKYLAGMSIENLLKGIVVAGADPSASDHLIGQDGMGGLRNHRIWTRYVNNSENLKNLKKRLTSDEQKMLKILEYYVLWIGRYRLAANADDHVEAQLARFELDLPLEPFITVFDALYACVSKELVTLVDEFTKKYGPSGIWFPA
jgi:hypothetical protein